MEAARTSPSLANCHAGGPPVFHSHPSAGDGVIMSIDPSRVFHSFWRVLCATTTKWSRPTGTPYGTVGRSCGVWSARMPCWWACNRAVTSRGRAQGRPTRPPRQGPLASTPRAAASFRPPFRPPLGPAARLPDPLSSHSEKLVGHGKIKYTRQTIWHMVSLSYDRAESRPQRRGN